MKKFFKKNTILDLLFLFFLSLTPLLWFKGNVLMDGHDDVFPLNPQVFFSGRLFTWIAQGFGQGQSLILGTIPVHFIDAFASFLGFPIQIDQRIVYVFWFFAMAISMYVLAHVINPTSRAFKLISSILYVFNFFILQAWWIFERTKFSAYVAFPLVLAIFIKLYRKELGPVKAALLISLVLFVFNAGGLFGTPLYGGMFVALGIFIVFFCFISILNSNLISIRNILVATILSGILYVITNAYFLVPSISQFFSQYSSGLGKGGGVSGFVDWASEISANASYGNLLRLQGIAEWVDNPHHPYSKYYLTNPVLIAISFLWPILIILPLYLYRKKSNDKKAMIFYLLLVFLLGIFFSAGTHPPLGIIYAFFIEHIPGFIIFRSPYFKFAPAIFLSASLLMAYSADYMRGKLRVPVLCLFVLLVLAYHFPYFTGNFFSWQTGFSTRNKIPNYVFQFSDWLNSVDEKDSRILLVPANSTNFQYSAYNWGYLSFQPLPTDLSNRSIVVNNDKLTPPEQELLMNLYSAIANDDKANTLRLASLLHINYLLLQNDFYKDFPSSLPLDPKIYKKNIVKDFQFPLVKEFGQWSVYKLPQTTSLVYTSTAVDSLDGSIKDVTNYLTAVPGFNTFVLQSDQNPINQDLTNNYLVPSCLGCPDKNNALVTLPDLTILPDSPLYPLVLWKESRTAKNIDPKSKIYNDIGISLKRISEIRAMIYQSKDVPDSVILSFGSTLNDVIAEFNSLDNFQDKFQLADDMQYYLSEEHTYLFPVLGTYVTNGAQAIKLGAVFQDINKVTDVISPYLFTLDTANNRLYQFTVRKTGDYDLIIKKDDFKPIAQNNGNISTTIDQDTVRQIGLDGSTSQTHWLSFGTMHLNAGIHHILLSFPPLPNLVDNLKEDNIEFTTAGESNCFTTKINGYDSKKVYKAKVDYRNDFSDDLSFYAWQQKDGVRKLISVVKLKSGLADEEYNQIIEADDASETQFGFCSKSLNADLIAKKISFTVNEIIYPSMLIAPQDLKSPIIKNMEISEKNPTQYTLHFSTDRPNTTLVFSQRFDAGWTIKEFAPTHFAVNGYANGWIVDKPGTYTVILSYRPQKYFYVGVVISIISVIGIIGYLIIKKKK